MKETELRLNNLFVQAGSNFVETVTFETFELLSRDAIKIGGIPLTEEWLLKCGYIKEVINEDGDGLYDHFYNGSIVHLWKFKGKYLFGKGWETELKYVHQLQNLYFALAGEELQISQ